MCVCACVLLCVVVVVCSRVVLFGVKGQCLFGCVLLLYVRSCVCLRARCRAWFERSVLLLLHVCAVVMRALVALFGVMGSECVVVVVVYVLVVCSVLVSALPGLM